MNKKGFAKIWTFLIIALSIVMIALISTYLITGVNKSINTNSRIQMITRLQTSIDEMLLENYGVKNKISLSVPNDIKKLCFIDFETTRIGLNTTNPDEYEKRMIEIANIVYDEYKDGNITNPENLYLFTTDEFELYKLNKITVSPIGGGIYCLNGKSKSELTLTSQGKKVLIE